MGSERGRDRAVVFVDGSNLYHSLKTIGIRGGELDYPQFFRTLCGPRKWCEARYYVGQVSADADQYAGQRRFLANLENDHEYIEVIRGRVERRTQTNELAHKLTRYLGGLETRIDPQVYSDLFALANDNKEVVTYKEKEVDVNLAVDMVAGAYEDAYDAAYIVSADGDYVPAAEQVQRLGKTVYAASPSGCLALREACKAFIKLNYVWFYENGCFRE